MQNFDPSQYLVERDRRKRNPSERKTGKILTVKSSIENVVGVLPAFPSMLIVFELRYH